MHALLMIEEMQPAMHASKRSNPVGGDGQLRGRLRAGGPTLQRQNVTMICRLLTSRCSNSWVSKSWRCRNSDFSRRQASSRVRAACTSAVSASCCACPRVSRPTERSRGNWSTDLRADMMSLILLPPCSHDVEKSSLVEDAEPACRPSRLLDAILDGHRDRDRSKLLTMTRIKEMVTITLTASSKKEVSKYRIR